MNKPIRKIFYILLCFSLDFVSIICNLVILFYGVYSTLLIIVGLITLSDGGIYRILQSLGILLISSIIKVSLLIFKDKAKEILAAKIL